MTTICFDISGIITNYFQDIFLGNEIAVPAENFGGVNIPKGVILYTRVMKLMDEYFLIGAGLFLSKKRLISLTEYMKERYKEFCDVEEKMSFKEFLKRNGELLHWWIRGIEEPEPIEDNGEE